MIDVTADVSPRNRRKTCGTCPVDEREIPLDSTLLFCSRKCSPLLPHIWLLLH